MTSDLDDVLRRLHAAEVEFIIVGGVAATLHGSARVTIDLDLLYKHDAANIARLVRALAPLAPYPREAPPGLPFTFDARTVSAGLNFTLETKAGPVDLLGEMVGVGRFEAALPHTISLALVEEESLVLDLDWLIRAKRAAGRPKDFEVIAELEILRDLRA